MSNRKLTSRVSGLVGFAASIVVQAQGLPPIGMPRTIEENVVVRVWPANRCSVLDRSTTCSRVADVLLRSANVSWDTAIHVYPQAKDDDTMSRVSQIASDLRTAGFRNVIRLINAPGP
jgi:hypothetical protein